MWFAIGIVVGALITFCAFVVYILSTEKPKKKLGTLWVDRSSDVYDIYFDVYDWEKLKKDGKGEVDIRGTASR